jgi:hypothetical protein
MTISRLVTALAVSATLAPLGAQTPPIAANPIVEVKGAIRQVHLSQGQGMPYLDVQRAHGTVRVYLGSMRYLIAENFSPKAGQEVVVKGYQTGDSVVAIEISLPAEKKTLKLRDSKGWPLWRGGAGRFGR